MMMMIMIMMMIFIILKITFQSNYVAKVMLAWREQFGIIFQTVSVSEVCTCIQIKAFRSCLSRLNWLSTMQSISYRTYVWQFRDVTFLSEPPSLLWSLSYFSVHCEDARRNCAVIEYFLSLPPSFSPVRCGQSLLHFRPTCWLIALEFQDY